MLIDPPIFVLKILGSEDSYLLSPGSGGRFRMAKVTDPFPRIFMVSLYLEDGLPGLRSKIEWYLTNGPLWKMLEL